MKLRGTFPQIKFDRWTSLGGCPLSCYSLSYLANHVSLDNFPFRDLQTSSGSQNFNNTLVRQNISSLLHDAGLISTTWISTVLIDFNFLSLSLGKSDLLFLPLVLWIGLLFFYYFRRKIICLLQEFLWSVSWLYRKLFLFSRVVIRCMNLISNFYSRCH